MTATSDAVAPADVAESSSRRPLAGRLLIAWIVALVGVRVWGLWVVDHARGDLFLGAVPLFGEWRWLITDRFVVPIAVVVAACTLLPIITASWTWRRVLCAIALTAVAWGASLAFTDPPAWRWTSIHDDYGQHIGRVDEHGVGAFLSDYVHDQPTFPTHLQAHPPGMVVLLWGADQVGLHGDGFEVLLALAGAAAAAVAALAALRNVAGEQIARRAAPFVVIAPAAIWHTNADSLYAGVAVSAVAFVVIATSSSGRRGDALAIAGGALFGAGLLLTYGVAALALPMVVVAIARRRLRILVVAAIATAATLALPALWGFSWVAGLQATKQQYDVNLATVRPYWYFVVANLAVFSLALGPAVIVGLAWLRDRRAWLLIGGGLAAVALADLTGLSLAEVERIWQPFMPLALLGGVGVTSIILTNRHRTRMWLIAQAATALVLQAALRSPW